MSVAEFLVTDGAPTPTGPFSQGVRRGPLLFTSGQAGRNRETGTMGDAGEQTTWALRNIAAILAAGGATMADVVKLTVYAREDADLAVLNAAYAEALPEPRPPRSLVLVSRLKGSEMLVEIEAVAVVD